MSPHLNDGFKQIVCSAKSDLFLVFFERKCYVPSTEHVHADKIGGDLSSLLLFVRFFFCCLFSLVQTINHGCRNARLSFQFLFRTFLEIVWWNGKYFTKSGYVLFRLFLSYLKGSWVKTALQQLYFENDIAVPSCSSRWVLFPSDLCWGVESL